MAGQGGVEDRRGSVCIGRVDVGTVGKESLDSFKIACLCRDGEAGGVADFAGGREKAQDRVVSRRFGQVGRGQPVPFRRYVGTQAYELCDRIRRLGEDRVPKRGRSGGIQAVRIYSRSDDLGDEVVAVAGGENCQCVGPCQVRIPGQRARLNMSVRPAPA